MKAMRQKLSSSQRYDAYASSVNKKYADADAKIQSLERDVSSFHGLLIRTNF